MWPIQTAIHSVIPILKIAFRSNRRVPLAMGALLLIFSTGYSYAQIDSGQFISSRPQTVSKNQLLAPGKAVHAIERARTEFMEGKIESAQKDIARALEVAPHFAVAEVMLGAIKVNSENYEAAKALFQQAIDDDPTLGAAYVGMAMVLIHQGQSKAALPVLDRAEGLLPTAWFVHFAKGWAELQVGDTQAALKQADCAEKIAGANSQQKSGVSYLRGMVSIHLNEMETARKHLAEAVERDRAGDYGLLAKSMLERLQPILAASR